jgi:PEGA domain
VRSSGAGARVTERDPRSTGLRAQPRPANQRPRGGEASYSYLYPYFGWGPYSAFDYYSPQYYGVGGWGWNRWGYGYNTWHDPFLYGSYYTAYPYYWGNLSDRESWADDDDARRAEPSGALRLRVSPREAKVYVDGALAGIVDEFDGLANHLRLPAGPHQIEFRADGYETVTLAVTVQDGKTRTERASLKRR